jgi:hypothetical protein
MDFDKIFNTFLDNRLRRADVNKTSDNFTKLLMERVNNENKTAVEEIKTDRLAKYIIGGFSFLTFLAAIFAGLYSSSGSKGKTGSISFEPTLQTSTNYFLSFYESISTFFVNLFGMLGLHVSMQTVIIIGGLILAFALFYAADRLLLRGKLVNKKI